MSQQLSCRGMCKILTWLDRYFSSKSNMIFFRDLDHELTYPLWNVPDDPIAVAHWNLKMSGERCILTRYSGYWCDYFIKFIILSLTAGLAFLTQAVKRKYDFFFLFNIFFIIHGAYIFFLCMCESIWKYLVKLHSIEAFIIFVNCPMSSWFLQMAWCPIGVRSSSNQPT